MNFVKVGRNVYINLSLVASVTPERNLTGEPVLKVKLAGGGAVFLTEAEGVRLIERIERVSDLQPVGY